MHDPCSQKARTVFILLPCIGDKLLFMSTGKKYEVLEVGVFHPEETPTNELFEGQVGYVVCNLKEFEEG
jgi:translation elongation factor EF-4